MARFALEDLQVRTVGIVTEQGNGISERMAEGFQEEAHRLGADVDGPALRVEDGPRPHHGAEADVDALGVDEERRRVHAALVLPEPAAA